MVERSLRMREARGSIPCTSILYFRYQIIMYKIIITTIFHTMSFILFSNKRGVAHMVERSFCM